MLSKKYVVLIQKKQDIEIDELEKILKAVSKDQRYSLYMFGDYQREIEKHGVYCFVEGEKNSIYDACNEFTSRGVNAIVYSKRDWLKALKYEFFKEENKKSNE